MNKKEIKKSFDDIFNNSSSQDNIEHETQMLMFRFLSEVERVAEERGVKNRKDLANLVGISASYLTQLFRGNKKLNFETVAKFQKTLNIVFEIKAENTFPSVSVKEKKIMPYYPLSEYAFSSVNVSP